MRITSSLRRATAPSSLTFCQTASYSHNGNVRVPRAVNEPILSYLRGSREREETLHLANKMKQQVVEIPLLIGGQEVKTGDIGEVVLPYDHKHVIAVYHKAGKREIQQAIEAAMEAKKKWESLPTEERLSIFLKAADLVAGPHRAELCAATMLNQGKNLMQAEIDAACELIDFWRFNCEYAQLIYAEQPQTPPLSAIWNRLHYRPLEGFVYAVSPFNFTAIGGNLPTAPAIMGNVALWKPSDSAIFSNYLVYKVLEKSGLPGGVINFVPGDAVEVTQHVVNSEHFSGLHYTGSAPVFRSLWKTIAQNIDRYKSYPRLVGETGGKDFIYVHPTAMVESKVVATALVRGAFEYSGQKCSACSRAFIPASKWDAIKAELLNQLRLVKIGSAEEPDVFMSAVIHRGAFERLKEAIELAKKDTENCVVLSGGGYDDSVGYFIEPTVVQVRDKNHDFLKRELFGPFLAIYVFEDDKWEEAVESCNDSEYSLTGSIFATDRYTIAELTKRLENAAGNFYINDKCTGSVVGQQPFGGSRASGTNDKAGSYLNLLRWVNARSIKETFVPASDPIYPYMKS